MAILNNSFFRLIGFKKRPKAPWKKYYGAKNMIFEVPNISIYEYLYRKHYAFRDNIALDYYGLKLSYSDFFKKIDEVSKAFLSYGVRKGDVVTILSANIPEALYVIYGLNKIGAVANIVHPLSAEKEIKEALDRYSSIMLVAMDICYSKIKDFIKNTTVQNVTWRSPA